MVLTQKQEEALKIAVERYKQKEPYTLILGYAGTGKTTLVKFIISALNLDAFDVCYVAYTGKAASVLKSHGHKNVSTAHKLLYDSYPRKDGTFYHKPKSMIPYYKLIVVDEISMLPKEMWNLLLKHKIHVLALGDPGQLPPVKSEENEILKHPHIFLDEVMRQAKENEIIRLSMEVREGKPLKYYSGEQVRIISPYEASTGLYLWGDQVIAGTNKKRQEINSIIKEKLTGVKDIPVEGDKVICLKNSWDTVSIMGREPLVNGFIGTISNVCEDRIPYLGNQYRMMIDAEDEDFYNVYVDKQLIETGIESINEKNFSRMPKDIRSVLMSFDYGYCITCWKSQGSEYDKVVLLAERNFPKDKELYKKYLYTGITRAKEKLVIVKY